MPLANVIKKGAKGLLTDAESAVRYGKKIGSEAINVVGVAATEAKSKLDKLARKVGSLGQ